VFGLQSCSIVVTPYSLILGEYSDRCTEAKNLSMMICAFSFVFHLPGPPPSKPTAVASAEGGPDSTATEALRLSLTGAGSSIRGFGDIYFHVFMLLLLLLFCAVRIFVWDCIAQNVA
jgi:hypothetical protein